VGRRTEFIGGRVLDACNENWSACDEVAGCVLGAENYLEGRLPGLARFLITTFEPSLVRVSVYVEEVRAAGLQTSVTFHETGCGSAVREVVEGTTFADESQRLGEFIREADLLAEGDHLLEFESDATANFLLKVDIFPKRP
jgi:hypothetical protein